MADTPDNTHNANAATLQNKVRDYQRAAETVKKKILITYGLDPETATLPMGRDGQEKSIEVKTAIDEYLESAHWESTCRTAAINYNKIPLGTEKQKALDAMAKDMMGRIIEGMSLRSAKPPYDYKNISSDPFYAESTIESFRNTNDSVQTALANLYINHVTNEAYWAAHTFGFSDLASIFLIDTLIKEIRDLSQKQNINNEAYIYPLMNKGEGWKKRIGRMQDYGETLQERLEELRAQMYPEGSQEAQDAKAAAGERSYKWREKQEARATEIAAQQHEK